MFEIGKIVKPQGLRGELRVFPTTDDPARFALLEEVFVRPPNSETTQKYAIVAARQQKGMVILSLQGVADRTAAEQLVGATLLIPDEWALPLDEDEYYVRDLIGCAAVDEDGAALGTIADVFSTGANDVYIIQPTDSEAFMVPAIKDVVRAVNLTDRRITLHLLAGLRELRALVRRP